MKHIKIFFIIVAEKMRQIFCQIKARYRAILWARQWQVPFEFACACPDLHINDETKSQTLYQFTLAGQTIEITAASPFLQQAPCDWLDELHSFRWLKNASQKKLLKIEANGLINEWITIWGDANKKTPTWATEICAWRVISWCIYYPNISSGKDERIMKSLVRQMKYLFGKINCCTYTRNKLLVLLALNIGTICSGQNVKLCEAISQMLDNELAKLNENNFQHFRSPKHLMELAIHLIALRALRQRPNAGLQSLVGIEKNIQPSIDIILDTLWQLQHSNGELGQFNGTATIDTKQLQQIFAFYNPARHIENRLDYYRMNQGKTVVLADGGVPSKKTSSENVFAGTLAFELSNENNKFIMNCGLTNTQQEKYLPFARTSAAHSTLVLENVSSSLYFKNSNFMIHAPKHVKVKHKHTQQAQTLLMQHDGYFKKYKIIHKRILKLSEGGNKLEGRDSIMANKNVIWHVRFHIGENIKSQIMQNNNIKLTSPDGNTWIFNSPTCNACLEESINFASYEVPQKTQQIVIENKTAGLNEIYWQFFKSEIK